MAKDEVKARAAVEGPRRIQAKTGADAAGLRAELARRQLNVTVETVGGAVYLVVPEGENPVRAEEVLRAHELAQAVARLRAASTTAEVKEAAAVCYEYALGLR